MIAERGALLREIAARATPLHERLRGAVEPVDPGGDPAAGERLAEWSRQVADADGERFAARLAHGGWSEETVRPLLGEVRLPPGAPLPRWTATLGALLDGAALPADETPRLAGKYRLPHEDLYRPLVAVAARRLRERAGARLNSLGPVAVATLERKLLERMAALGALAVELEFSVFRATRASGLSLLVGRLAASPSDQLYRAFVDELRQGGLAELLREYAVLARLLAVAVDQWVDGAVELAARLGDDEASLAACFHGGRPLGEVTTFAPGLSDPHEGGRTVALIGFACGVKLVYKPKDLGLEQAFNQLLAAFNRRSPDLNLRVLRVLPRDGYGWVEFAAHAPCAGEAELARFYRRAGALLCLVYLLDGTDCHFENLVAAGEHPVLVDTETFFYNRGTPNPSRKAEEVVALLDDQIWDSVLRTGLLPRWEQSPDGDCFDVSGLGAVREQKVSGQVADWSDLNTDSMAVSYRTAVSRPRQNRPFADGDGDPARFAEEVVGGFRAAHELLAAHRPWLLSDDGPLAPFAAQPFRFVFRPTRAYASMQFYSLQPDLLRDGIDRSILLERFARNLMGDERAASWRLLDAEQAALERLDVPRFVGRTDGRDLIAGEHTIAGYFARPSGERVRERMAALSPEDRERQVGLVRGAFRSLLVSDGHGAATPAPAADPEPAAERLSRAELLDAAGAIYRELATSAIAPSPEARTWIVLRYFSEARRYQLYPMGHSLYDGECGVALFLAAWARLTGDGEARALALGALANLRRALRRPDGDPDLSRIGIGGGLGVSSLAYGLVRAGALLDEDLAADAARAAALVTPARIAADPALDVMFGAGGALLGLLAVHRATGDGGALDAAVACGRRLLAAQRDQGGWPDGDGHLASGFAHGAAGIACALTRLYAVTGEPSLLASADRAIAFERTLYFPRWNNWLYYHTALATELKDESFRSGWCHGAPGIALSRLAGLAHHDTPEVRRDLDDALARTRTAGPGTVDHLCCGELGRAEVLLVAGRRLGRADLISDGELAIGAAAARARRNGAWRIFADRAERLPVPSLFQGMSGIGYQLLRAAAPEEIPSLLSLE